MMMFKPSQSFNGKETGIAFLVIGGLFTVALFQAWFVIKIDVLGVDAAEFRLYLDRLEGLALGLEFSIKLPDSDISEQINQLRLSTIAAAVAAGLGLACCIGAHYNKLKPKQTITASLLLLAAVIATGVVQCAILLNLKKTDLDSIVCGLVKHVEVLCSADGNAAISIYLVVAATIIAGIVWIALFRCYRKNYR